MNSIRFEEAALTPDLTDPALRRLVVTSHPNHELAIFGFVQRMCPHMLFLTDGGGPERVAESREALASLGLGHHAHFFDWTEMCLYEALLSRDVSAMGRLVAEVRRHLIALAPAQVICESIELYNPLHDLTLPIVQAAASGLRGIDIVEFPLIAQEPAPSERYRVQRFPRGRASVRIALEPRELERKLHARDHHYRILGHTMGDVLASVPPEVSGVECFGTASGDLPLPGRDHVLRYELRGRLLRERGEIDRVITFAGDFVPVVRALQALSF